MSEQTEARETFAEAVADATRAELDELAEGAGLDVKLKGRVADRRTALLEAFDAQLAAEDADAPAEDADAPAEDADAPAEDADAPADDADAPADDAKGDRIEVLVDGGTSRRVLPAAKAEKLIAENKAIYIEHSKLPLS